MVSGKFGFIHEANKKTLVSRLCFAKLTRCFINLKSGATRVMILIKDLGIRSWEEKKKKLPSHDFSPLFHVSKIYQSFKVGLNSTFFEVYFD